MSVAPWKNLEPRAKNLRLKAKTVADCTAAWVLVQSLQKAERGSRRRTTGMAEDQNGLFKCGQRFGKNSVKSKREWRLMALSKNLVEWVGTHDFLAMT